MHSPASATRPDQLAEIQQSLAMLVSAINGLKTDIGGLKTDIASHGDRLEKLETKSRPNSPTKDLLSAPEAKDPLLSPSAPDLSLTERKSKKSMPNRATIFGPNPRRSLAEYSDNSDSDDPSQVPQKLVVSNLKDFEYSIDVCTIKAMLELETEYELYLAKFARQVHFRDYVTNKLRQELIQMYLKKDNPHFKDRDWFRLSNREVMKVMLAKAMPQTQSSWIKTWRSTCRLDFPRYAVTLARYDLLATQILQYIDICKRCFALIKDAAPTANLGIKTAFFSEKKDHRFLRPALMKKAQDFSGTKSDSDSLIGLFLSPMPPFYANLVHRYIFPDGAKLAGDPEQSFELYLDLWTEFLRSSNADCIQLRPVFESVLLFNEAITKRSNEHRSTVAPIVSHHFDSDTEDEDKTQSALAAFQGLPPSASVQKTAPKQLVPRGCCWARLRDLPCKETPCPFDHSVEAARKELADLQKRIPTMDGRPIPPSSRLKIAKPPPKWVGEVKSKPRLASVDIQEALTPEQAMLLEPDSDCDQLGDIDN